MSVVQFTDGFPNEPLAAINFSYFLTPDEKKEWMDWLASAKPEQQDELVQILHQMWESAKAENPNGAPAPSAIQPAPAQQMQQSQPQMHQQHQNFGQPQMMPPQGHPQMQPNFGQPQQQFNPNFGQPQIMQQGQMPPQPMMQPQPQMQQPRPNNMMGNPAAAAIASLSQSQPPMGMQNMQPQQYAQSMMQQPMPQQFIPQPQMQQPLPPIPAPEPTPEFSFDTEEDVKNYVPEKPVEQVIPQPKAPTKIQQIEEEEIEELDNDFMLDDNQESENAIVEDTKIEKQVSGIDFSAIRDNADKEEINKLTDEFLTAREAHEKAYTDLIKKNTKIFSDFEDINDYIESMTDKVLTINDQVINQGEEIQLLKNGTQARGSSLQDQTDEIRYDIEKLVKEIRNVKIEQKRAVDEIRTRLSTIESNSFRNDGNDFELKYNILKSQVEKLQQQNNFDKIAPKSEPVTKSSRAERLNSISSKNFVG